MTTRRKILTLCAALTLVLGLGACGDDDDDETAVADDETSETTAAEGDHDEEMGQEEGNPCAPDAPDDALPPAEELDADATPVTITAKEYEFGGTDALAAGGAFGITFQNEGNEIHELVLQKIDDAETRSVEEMLQLEEPPDTVTDVAFGVACPGDTTTFNADLSEPGRYVALCFVPVGATADATEEPQGPPHAMQGMVVELELS
jgi:hypothetical protein